MAENSFKGKLNVYIIPKDGSTADGCNAMETVIYPGNGMGFKKLERSKSQVRKFGKKHQRGQNEADDEIIAAGYSRKEFKKIMRREFKKREPQMYDNIMKKEIYKTEFSPQDTPVVGCDGCGQMIMATDVKYRCVI